MPYMTGSKSDHPHNQFGPVPGEDDVAHARRLRADGLKVVDVAKALNISERQTYRLLAAGNERVQRRDMDGWSLTTSLEDADEPEKTRYLFETTQSTLWRRHSADFAWKVHQLKQELPSEIVQAFAGMYVNASRRTGRDREVWSRILDLALVAEPWSGQENEDRFFEELHARNESDLEFAARVFSYLNEIASNWHGIIRVAGPVPDQVGWLRTRVLEIEREEKGGPSTVRPIETPGNRDANKRKS